MNLSPLYRTSVALRDFCANQAVPSGPKLLKVTPSPEGSYLESIGRAAAQKSWTFVDYLKSFFEVGEYSLANVVLQIERSGCLNRIQKPERDVMIRALNAKILKHNSRWFKFVTIAPFQVVAEKVTNVAQKTLLQEMVTPGGPDDENLSESEKTSLQEIIGRVTGCVEGIAKLPALSQVKLVQLQADFFALHEVARKTFLQNMPPKLEMHLKSLGDLLEAFQASLQVNKIYQQHYVFDKQANVIRQKGDGNCLYYSVSQGLEFLQGSRHYAEGIGVTPPQGERYTKEELRGLIKKYFEDNYLQDPHLQMLIKDAIYQLNLSMDSAIRESRLNYLASLTLAMQNISNTNKSKHADLLKNTRTQIAALQRQVDDLTDDEFVAELRAMQKAFRSAKIPALTQVIQESVTSYTQQIREINAKKIKLPEDAELQDVQKQGECQRVLEAAYRRYFEKTKEDRFWGAIPEIYALARIFQCKITVSRNRGAQAGRVVDEHAMSLIRNLANPIGSIHLDFENLDHFNLYIEN